MSRDQLLDEAVLEDVEQAIEYFHQGAKAPTGRGVGTEHEKFIFSGPDCELIDFDGPGGIESIFDRLADEHGWMPERDRGRTVALSRGDEAVTLEPGGQVELSGGVKKTIFETAAEFDRHIDELAGICGPDYRSVSFGLNPFDGLDDGPWVPKARYGVMKRYLAGQGDMAHWMMKGTCTIQANLDYTSEEDAVEFARVAVYLSPLVNALFANSPLRLGKPTGMQSFRGHLWTRTDPDRTGVPDFMYRDDWGFREWTEWVLDVPMFFIRRPGGYVDLSGTSFRTFMEEGYGGTPATMGDFELHLSTVFPEVRIKRFIEVRSADGGPREHVFALSALWKGLIYHAASRRDALRLFDGVTPREHGELFEIAAVEGIHGEWRGERIADLAREVVELADEGLTALAEGAGHPSESEFLDPLREILETETSVADRLLADFERCAGDRSMLIREYDMFSNR